MTKNNFEFLHHPVSGWILNDIDNCRGYFDVMDSMIRPLTLWKFQYIIILGHASRSKTHDINHRLFSVRFFTGAYHYFLIIS